MRILIYNSPSTHPVDQHGGFRFHGITIFSYQVAVHASHWALERKCKSTHYADSFNALFRWARVALKMATALFRRIYATYSAIKLVLPLLFT